MRTFRTILVLLFFLIAASACGEPPKVLQGTVTTYDAASKVIKVQDEAGENQELLFSLVGAEIGAEPVVGDKVRLAYYDKSGSLVVTRLMNLTRQQELVKSAH
ncbi:MAG: hypothetical protein JXA30_12480 [Deltaproteobacteria bacterium]|nr:hypothetical protein [Deltaproteobacteria bacterium]